LTVIVAFTAFAIVGCGSTTVDPAVATNLKAVASMYTEYSAAHSNTGPTDLDSFKKFARTIDSRTLGSLGIELNRLDDFFVSPRDKQPLQIRFGVPVTNLGQNAPLIAHEQTGVGGKKLAVYANNKILELDDAALKQAIEGKTG